MIPHFPSPVLSVAADVVQELEGEDALYGLWTLFTKCKESLKDGRRLENLSWRLWYREIAASHTPSSSPGSLSPSSCGRRSPTPITPVSEDGPGRDDGTSQPCLHTGPAPSTAHSWHGDVAQLSVVTASRRLSIASAPADRPQPTIAVGRFLIDILPTKLDIAAHKKSIGSPRGTFAHVPPSSALPVIVQPRPVVAIQVHSTPSVPAPAFPRVVVVNPTPHPTPPATPNISRGAQAPSVTPAATHLLPPPPTRNMVTAPTTATPVKATVTSSQPAVMEQSASSMSHVSQTRNWAHCDDATLKPSDRRFFLQEVVHSPERDSVDSSSQPADARSESHEQSPSSTASSQLKSDARSAGAGTKRGTAKTQCRKSREPVRHVRPTAIHRTQTQMQLHRPAAHRKAGNGDAKKTTFNIGSASSNGSRSVVPGPSRQVHKEHKELIAPKVRHSEPAKQTNGLVPERKNIVVSSSSDYTDSDDDSEWASEDNSTEERDRLEREREETRLREAAEEAQRQRDMFAKVPKRSYSNLNRTGSGLLSQLLNPDPNIFPPSHPYRVRGFSSQDMTQLKRQAAPPSLSTSKSTVSMGLTQITAQAPPTNGGDDGAKGRQRQKGRPQSAELEDDSDSGEESVGNTIQVSRSLAQQKLAALADPNRRRHSDRGPPPAEPVVRPQFPSVATAPIPLGHPYNLPAPAPPMTPRTTRRQMLSTELSESLRRNLLWERQVSRNNMTGARRGGLLGNGLRPLTAVNTDAPRQNEPGTRSGNEADDREARRQRAAARNRSWADDYHFVGW
ncbi:uncharacterized protein FIBRA_05740 [Fibroporia radiculosa]|uniref:Uncharacterized protein n=1 Tax=Fibroporia radiculosa TaxID=599839 RepID=J4HY16_9APHY|nr:uncharacterized protein FIBRA_05740 [Fibroporia radiculosa]CCM03602.1 predicted protein [Fibroporia radiculosa]